MKKALFAAGAVAMGISALLGGSNTFAASGDTAVISGDKTVQVCIDVINQDSSTPYTGSNFAANITGTGYEAQILFEDFAGESCKNVKLPAGNYTVVMQKSMGVTVDSYTYDTNKEKLSFDATKVSSDVYLSNYGFSDQSTAATKVEISFNANGGTGTMAPVVDDYTNTITLPTNTLTKTGYTFDGWNTKADGSGAAYADGATLTFTQGGEVELFAQWIVRTATLQSGQNVNSKLKTLAKGSSVEYDSRDTLIRNLSFVDMLPSTVDENTPKVNIALDGEIPVYAYWVANDKVIYINTEANKIYANSDSSYMFCSMVALTSLTLPSSFDTSNVTNMRFMFYDMDALTSFTLPDSFNTSKVTDMRTMFGGMGALTSLTLPSSFDTSNVTNMQEMFYKMPALASLTLPDSFNTSNVTNMSYMFYFTPALASLTLPDSFNTSNVTNMSGMFESMEALTSLTLPTSFVISNGTITTLMFAGIKNTATLYAADATARSLWPGVLGN